MTADEPGEVANGDRPAGPRSLGPDAAAVIGLAGLLVAVPAVAVGVLVAALSPLPWWLGVLVGLVVAAAVTLWWVGRADDAVLDGLGHARLDPSYSPRLLNLVGGLSLAGGVVVPELVVLDDPALNAMALRCRGRNHLVVTRGLLDRLGVVELEGTIAELLTRLRNGDAAAATLGAALFGRPVIDGPLRAVLAPLADRALGRLLSDDRDLEADRQAVSLTRYPPGLLAALEAMRSASVRPAAASDGTAHLWLVDPGSAAGTPSAEHRAPLGLRIDALAEL